MEVRVEAGYQLGVNRYLDGTGILCTFRLFRPWADRRTMLAYREDIPKVDEHELRIEAGQYSGENSLQPKGVGLIDAAIIVAARRSAAMIRTLDQRLARALGTTQTYVP